MNPNVNFHNSSTILLDLQRDGVPALCELFERNRASLRNMLSKRISGQIATRFDESDIIQEAYVRAERRLSDYLREPGIHPNAWIRVLCRQLLAENIRKHMLECRTPLKENHFEVGEDGLEMLIDSTDSVGTKLGRNEALAKLISSLSGTDREILMMRHSESMLFREIAETLEMKTDTVKKRYYRALEQMDALNRCN